MTDYLKKVVVTGMGVISPIGLNVQEFWKNLLDGKSGVVPITKFDTSEYATKFAAEVKDFKPEDYIEPRELRRMDPFCHFAVAAANMAIEDAGISQNNSDPNRIGVIVGSGIGGMYIFEKQVTSIIENGPRRITPFFIPIMIIDIAAGRIAIMHNFKGPNFATVSACATASHAIGVAVDTIRLNRADAVVCGGSEAPICRTGVGGFNAMRAISTRNDEPQKASRPFDKDRDGFVVGEGAGMLVIESEEHAKNRGAKIYAEICGIGFTADAYHITAPAPGGEGAVRAMNLALQDAGIQPQQLDYINAHGTSTVLNDKNETEAIKTLFGEHAYKLKISSTKSMIGHLLGAAGAVEAIAAIMSIREDTIHPTINYDTPDPDCDLDYVPNKSIKHQVNYALSNTFGFGGHNACLLFAKYNP